MRKPISISLQRIKTNKIKNISKGKQRGKKLNVNRLVEIAMDRTNTCNSEQNIHIYVYT